MKITENKRKYLTNPYLNIIQSYLQETIKFFSNNTINFKYITLNT